LPSLDHIEEQKASLLRSISHWTEERLHFRPRGGEWCAIEVLDHLVRTEAAVLEAASTGVATPRRIGLSDRVRTAFLVRLFRSQTRVKAPGNVTQILPATGLRLMEITGRWDLVRKDLRLFLEKNPAEQLQKGIFRHPIGGWMNASGILTFFSVHIIHHGFQLHRLASASRESVR